MMQVIKVRRGIKCFHFLKGRPVDCTWKQKYIESSPRRLIVLKFLSGLFSRLVVASTLVYILVFLLL